MDYALSTNNVAVIELVNSYIPDINLKKSLQVCCVQGAINSFDYIVNKYQPDLKKSDSVYNLVKYKQLDMLEYVLDKYKLPVNKTCIVKKDTMLHSAYSTLLKMTPKEAPNRYKQAVNGLSEACVQNNIKAVDILCSHGANFQLNNGYAFECALAHRNLIEHIIINNYIQPSNLIETILNIHKQIGHTNKNDYVLPMMQTVQLACSLDEQLPVNNNKSSKRKI